LIADLADDEAGEAIRPEPGAGLGDASRDRRLANFGIAIVERSAGSSE
jgi:hypothetical protein